MADKEKQEVKQKTCYECGSDVSADMDDCPKCGFPITSFERYRRIKAVQRKLDEEEAERKKKEELKTKKEREKKLWF